MARKVYTPADHQRAFELWYETRNLLRTSQIIGCEYTTIRDWMLDTYNCKYGCAWHGWERLDRERKAALEARFKLLEDGNLDPLEHDRAIREAVDKAKSGELSHEERRRLAIETVVRSDLERISHFELLYGKIFHQTTGLIVDQGGIHGLAEGADRYKSIQQLYQVNPLKVTNMESAVRALIQITEFIKKLQEDLGVKKRSSSGTTVVDNPETVNEEPQESQQLTIEELRKFRELLEHTPPDKVEILKKIMRADDAQISVALGESPKVEASAELELPPPPALPEPDKAEVSP